MTEEVTTEPVVSESVPEPAPVQPEPIIEPTPAPEPININGSNGENGNNEIKTEPAPTAQPVEPLNPEPIAEPQLTSEPLPEPSIPAPEPTQAPEPVSAPEPQVVVSVSLVSRARELLVKAREVIQFRKRKKLEKIIDMFLKQSSITNDDVQKLLYVSDATATRYLRQLEIEGKVRRQGVPGHASYSRI